MGTVKYSERGVSVEQCEPVSSDAERGVRCRVVRDDGILFGEFTLQATENGWQPFLLPGASHEGLALASAIDFAEQVSAGRIVLD
jgi:hypothetical protein